LGALVVGLLTWLPWFLANFGALVVSLLLLLVVGLSCCRRDTWTQCCVWSNCEFTQISIRLNLLGMDSGYGQNVLVGNAYKRIILLLALTSHKFEIKCLLFFTNRSLQTHDLVTSSYCIDEAGAFLRE
jgi:hypothetical protein